MRDSSSGAVIDSRMFGVMVDEPLPLPARINRLLESLHLAFEPLDGLEERQLQDEIRSEIKERSWEVSGERRRDQWEAGWQDELGRFEQVGSGTEPVPQFLQNDAIVRINGRFARPRSEQFESRLAELILAWVDERFFGNCSSVYEFGCGSGHNLVRLAKSRPDRQYTGLDWSASALEIVRRAAYDSGLPIAVSPFDFFDPPAEFTLPPGAGVLTVCALEQVGSRHDKFMSWLLNHRPAVAVHLEPIYEFYNPVSTNDQLAMEYHRRRGYLDGLLTRTRELEAGGKIEILKARRLGFGSRFHEGYSVVAWRPLP